MENVQSVIPRIALEKNEEIEVLILTSLRRLPIYNSKILCWINISTQQKSLDC